MIMYDMLHHMYKAIKHKYSNALTTSKLYCEIIWFHGHDISCFDDNRRGVDP